MSTRNLETSRLRLRPFQPEDLDALCWIDADPEVMRYIGKGVRSREETAEALADALKLWEEHGFGPWAVLLKTSGTVIGRCGLRFLDDTPEIELGYRFARAYWGMGLATEAARAVLAYGFDVLQLDRIAGIADPDNWASRRVLEKSGMRYEKQARYYNTDVAYYAVSRTFQGKMTPLRENTDGRSSSPLS